MCLFLSSYSVWFASTGGKSSWKEPPVKHKRRSKNPTLPERNTKETIEKLKKSPPPPPTVGYRAGPRQQIQGRDPSMAWLLFWLKNSPSPGRKQTPREQVQGIADLSMAWLLFWFTTKVRSRALARETIVCTVSSHVQVQGTFRWWPSCYYGWRTRFPGRELTPREQVQGIADLSMA